MTKTPSPALGLAAAGVALPYIASKVHYALAGRLGVFGGPHVTDDDYRRFGSTRRVAAAQWSNVVAGVMFSAMPIAASSRSAARLNRWAVAAPLIATSGMLGATGVFTLVRSVSRRAGGAPFGAYLLGWSALLGASGRAHLGNRQPIGPEA